jgi:hypothetical protein
MGQEVTETNEKRAIAERKEKRGTDGVKKEGLCREQKGRIL